MAQKIHHFKNFSIINDAVDIHLDMDRLSDNFRRAQFELDSAVMTSMIPYMPMQDETFIKETRARSASLAGSGEVCAGAGPQGRFLYEGKTMVDEKTGSPWAREGAKKVLVSQYQGKTNAKENLSFSTNKHPRAQAHWFDAAKKADLTKWERIAKRNVGGK